jgi:hypothetical protein
MRCVSVLTLRLRNLENLAENTLIAVESRLYGATDLTFLEPIIAPSILLYRPDCRVNANRKLFVLVEIVVQLGPSARENG